MLEIIRTKHLWNWGACGKHPLSKDYFRTSTDDPFLQAFSDWIENGYRRLNPEHGSNPVIYSWRFWAKGPKKGSLVCGVGRDSSDSLGRPYPLLIMGTGPLKGWENQWDLLPAAFENTWSQIEYLATGRFVDFKQMEDEVRNIKPPGPNWQELESLRSSPEPFKSFSNGRLQWDAGDIKEKIESLKKNSEVFIPLKRELPDSNFDFVSRLHFLVKKALAGVVPNSIFMGGLPDNTCLAVFMRPLAPNDFVHLWSFGAEDNR